MTLFVLNIVLAITWAAVTGPLSIGGLAVGYVVGYLVLLASRPLYGETTYFQRVPRAIGFGLFFLKELIVASLKIAVDVVTPPIYARPAVVGVPLGAKSDAEITLLANIITLTPGTLALDISADRRTLFVHVMYLESADALRMEIKTGFERRILELLR